MIARGRSPGFITRFRQRLAPDGRFRINTVLDEATAPITLLMNWHPEAKK